MVRPASRLSLLALVAFSTSCGLLEPEEDQVLLYVAPQRVDCVGVESEQCLLVNERVEAPWQLFYDAIEGFEYQPGFTYKLLVSKRRIVNPPADGSSVAWRLIRMLERTPS